MFILLAWEKAFKAIYPILRSYRHKRLVKECAAVFRPRFAALQAAILAHYVQLPRTAQMDYHPDSVDLPLMGECRAIADVPADQAVTQEDFARIVPELAARWEQERKKELTEAVIAHLPAPPPDGVDVLGLGIAIFPCSECTFADHIESRRDAFYRYPAILSHPCAHARDHGFEETHNKNMKVYPTLAASRWYPFAFSPYHLGSTIRYLSQVMRTMGLDPSRTTEEELQASPAQLRCRECQSDRARYVERNKIPPYGMSKIHSWEAAMRATTPLP